MSSILLHRKADRTLCPLVFLSQKRDNNDIYYSEPARAPQKAFGKVYARAKTAEIVFPRQLIAFRQTDILHTAKQAPLFNI